MPVDVKTTPQVAFQGACFFPADRGATQVRASPAVLSTWAMAGCPLAVMPFQATSSSEMVQVFLKMASP